LSNFSLKQGTYLLLEQPGFRMS